MADNLAEKLFKTVKQSLMSAPGELAKTLKQSLMSLPGEAAAEMKYQVGAGAHELAAALFNGSGFVMYPRGDHDDHSNAPDHGLGAKGLESPSQKQEHGMGI